MLRQGFIMTGRAEAHSHYRMKLNEDEPEEQAGLEEEEEDGYSGDFKLNENSEGIFISRLYKTSGERGDSRLDRVSDVRRN